MKIQSDVLEGPRAKGKQIEFRSNWLNFLYVAGFIILNKSLHEFGNKAPTLAATELESSKASSQQDCLKIFFLSFLKYTFMFLRSLISIPMSD